MRSLKIALIGEVDAGKSTTLGQLLIKTGSVMRSKLEEASRTSRELNKDFEPAFLLDAFEYERTNEMTLDITSTYIKWWGEELRFLDTPGHKELNNKFLGGAADCDFALVVIDSSGPTLEQHFRHIRSLTDLGLAHYGVIINKISEPDESRFTLKMREVKTFLKDINEPQFIIPLDAKSGIGFDEVKTYDWFSGAPFLSTLRVALGNFAPRQGVKAVHLHGPFWRLENGTINQGVTELCSPANVEVHTAEPSAAPAVVRLKVPRQCEILGSPGQVVAVSETSATCLPLEGDIEGADSIQFGFGVFPVRVSKQSGNKFRLQFMQPQSLFLPSLNGKPNRDNLFTLKRDNKIIAVGVPT